MNVQAEPPGQPSGVLTFLFTDIEGSTRRWEADAEAMRAALERHDDVLREAITECGGSLFKHTGDGVCAVFGSPRAAIDAAVTAQRALELPVRMGVATGEAQMRHADYFGPVLNRVARLMSAGHGGQILLDGATAGLLGRADLTDLGPRRLRDITNTVNIFQVEAVGLPTEYPPLKTLNATSGNLRRPSTSIVGRDSELSDLEAAVKVHRLVTLTGVGGVGKTRLALEAAWRSSNVFPDGTFVVELAAITDPATVPDAVAAVLGITRQPGLTVTESVAAASEDRTRLLVFDNCEHVLDAAADLIDAIIAGSGTTRILATSREGLRVADEQLWPVRSLDVDSSAAALFIERASAVGSSTTSPEDEVAITEICRRLDGNPLAIELAASRLQSMTVAELRDRLDDRFRILVGSRRGIQRHQTLRHAVQWSYDLLEDAEQSLLQRCSVFSGGFDLDAAIAVGRGGDEFATLDLLDALVRKSLLTADRSARRTRFAMLETIRQFAADQLVEGGAADAARTAHAQHFADLEPDVLARWDSPHQRDSYSWFALELANLRSAFRWAADHHELDIAAAIAFYATLLGHHVAQYEPVSWVEELIEPARAVEHPRLAQLYVMATECYSTGRADDAVGFAEAAQRAIEGGGFDAIPYEWEAELGGAYTWIGRPERWIELCRRMIAREPGTHPFARAALVFALSIAGASDEAVVASRGVLAAAEEIDNPAMLANMLLACGFALRHADPAAAYELHRRGLTIADESGNRWVGSQLAMGLASLAAHHGDPVDAFDYFTLAIRNYYDSGNFSVMLSPLAILAAFFDRLGHYEPAATISGFAATPATRRAYPAIKTAVDHLRDVLGDEAYESFARSGQNMSAAAMATYAFDQIERARADLLAKDGSA